MTGLRKTFERIYRAQQKPMTRSAHAAMADLYEAREITETLTDLRRELGEAEAAHKAAVIGAGVIEKGQGPLPTGHRPLSDTEAAIRKDREARDSERFAAEQAQTAAQRQRDWQAERQRIIEAQKQIRRTALDAGEPLPDLPSVPVQPPFWFQQRDGVRYLVAEEITDRHADGTRTIYADRNLITGQVPGEQALTPEQQFQQASK